MLEGSSGITGMHAIANVPQFVSILPFVGKLRQQRLKKSPMKFKLKNCERTVLLRDLIKVSRDLRESDSSSDEGISQQVSS